MTDLVSGMVESQILHYIFDYLCIRDIHAITLTCKFIKERITINHEYKKRFSEKLVESGVTKSPAEFIEGFRRLGCIAVGEFVTSLYYGFQSTSSLALHHPKPIDEKDDRHKFIAEDTLCITLASVGNEWKWKIWVKESAALDFVSYHYPLKLIEKYKGLNKHGKAIMFTKILNLKVTNPFICRKDVCPKYGDFFKTGLQHFSECYSKSIVGSRIQKRDTNDANSMDWVYYGESLDYEDMMFDGETLHLGYPYMCATKSTKMNWWPDKFQYKSWAFIPSLVKDLEKKVKTEKLRGFKFPAFIDDELLINEYVAGKAAASIQYGQGEKYNDDIRVLHKRKRLPDHFYTKDELEILSKEHKKK